MKEMRRAQELEEWLDREVKGQPDLPAPATLVHRVMLAVHERAQQPWWRRAWPEWPRPVQVLSLGVLGVLASCVIAAGVALSSDLTFSFVWQELRLWVGAQVPALPKLGALANAGAVLFRSTLQQFFLGGLLLALGTYVACIALTTTCYRLCIRRVS
jgi:hypothetical protein